ncbi:hypothetical protein [Vibrio vulnificus]|uniref:Uncharacterized protein n=2 Tax=Vibrio vulnificus TaxID=672 RepID=A0AAN1PUI0_VIBVL|nr:hypothetical protein [Vibrio vulnificus]AXX63254.1 hypothetical protein FORC53_4915 [Vibrio vulnificus]
MDYKFKYTKENGFKQVKIAPSVHNENFIHRKIIWCDRYEYFLNEDTGVFAMIRLANLPAKLFVTIAYPVSLLLHGLNNFKSVNKEVYEIWNQKETGTFSVDESYRSQQGWNDLMDLIT